MTAKAEDSAIQRSIESIQAYGGSGLSLLSSRLSIIQKFTVGPENEDRHLPDTYPLTPMFWRVIKTRLDELKPGVLADHVSEVKSSSLPKPWQPKNFPNVGINSVPIEAIRTQRDEEYTTPVVFWPFGNHILASPIPSRHLEGLDQGTDFFWAMRYIEDGQFGVGKLYAGRLVVEEAARTVESVLPHQVQAGTPAY